MPKMSANLCFIKNKVLAPQATTQETRKCSTCDVSFSDPSSQKLHFKSEWHLYNVKRKNSQINPISYDDYVVIKAQIQELLAAKTSKTSDRNLSNKSKGDHSSLKSKGSSKQSSQAQREESVQTETTRNITEFDVKKCLFSNVVSENILENVKYMEKQYSFYLPEKEYISDLPGLLRFVHDKIIEYNVCIYCNRLFADHYAVLHHMVGKQHHKLNDDNFDEIRQFYDFTGSYLRFITNLPPTVLNSNDGADNEDDWEDVITTTTDGDKITELLSSYGLKKAHITESGNLSLPNGKEAVHRELSYIYKQNLVVHSSYNLKNKQENFKFKKKSEKRQIIMTQNQSQYRTGKRDLRVAVKSYKLFVPIRQDICFG
ncbi:hypothetical protein BEWA_018240 [Theileria equi strain WA]|uniref:C2H2-type domain-containing protein n=1 Tax=Theileria equi strain WA TaxID=1537102 RepID=L0AVE2_THEEQ|nr:hypothetical protein BEWA_018240 [Theileria equi strain WA]AFZ78981.1 hypothetical protein BEWA_018240 [Theileria equi strain WA]|eukprot:XP_004828647.1 hypothetical protein BEWA_018240 [Theileria equi strain WA]